MLKFISVFIIAFSFSTLRAQSYYVGNPVNDTLYYSWTGVGYSATACPDLILDFSNILPQDPAGTQIYFKIVSAINMPANSLHEISNGVLNVGDSIAVSPSNDIFKFYSSNGNIAFYCGFFRSGIPTTVNDSFFCKQNIYDAPVSYVDGCTSVLERDFFTMGSDSCAVNGALALSSFNFDLNQLHISPNPSNGNFHLVGIFPPQTKFDVYDMLGQKVFSQAIEAGDRSEEIYSDLDRGMYMYRITTPEKILYSDKLVITK